MNAVGKTEVAAATDVSILSEVIAAHVQEVFISTTEGRAKVKIFSLLTKFKIEEYNYNTEMLYDLNITVHLASLKLIIRKIGINIIVFNSIVPMYFSPYRHK